MQDSYHEAVRVISETESSGGKHRSMLDGIAPDRVHAVDAHSNKSGPGLVSPTTGELAGLAQKARMVEPRMDLNPPKPAARSL